MKRLHSYICVVLALALLMASCSHKPKLIPRDKLVKIHMEMLLADQWLKIENSFRRMADTSVVYGPILEKYKYNVDDYRYTVHQYLDQPEEFSKMFDETTELLRVKLDSLNRRIRAKEKADSTMRALLAMDIPKPELYSKFFEKMYARDTISLVMDSMHVYRLQEIIHDTMFDGPRLVIKEPPVPDSLSAGVDSLLAGADSLKGLAAIKDTTGLLELVGKTLGPMKKEEVRNKLKIIKAADDKLKK